MFSFTILLEFKTFYGSIAIDHHIKIHQFDQIYLPQNKHNKITEIKCLDARIQRHQGLNVKKGVLGQRGGRQEEVCYWEGQRFKGPIRSFDFERQDVRTELQKNKFRRKTT